MCYTGFCRFCDSNRSLLPISIDKRPHPREPLLVAFIMILHAVLWRSVIMLDEGILRANVGHCQSVDKGDTIGYLRQTHVFLI